MAVIVSSNGLIKVAGTNLSDHCKSFKLNLSQETRDVTAHGATQHVFRAGLSNTSVEAEFYLDHATGSVEQTLRPLVSITSTGFDIVLQKIAGSTANPTSTGNPIYTLTCVVDGDISVLNEAVGEVGMITCKFVPYASGITLTTTSS